MARTPKTPTFAVPTLDSDQGTRIGQLQDIIDRCKEAIVDAVLEGRAAGKTWAELRTASGMRRSKMQRLIVELRGDDVLQNAIDGVETVRETKKAIKMLTKSTPKASAAKAKTSKTPAKKAPVKKTTTKRGGRKSAA